MVEKLNHGKSKEDECFNFQEVLNGSLLYSPKAFQQASKQNQSQVSDLIETIDIYFKLKKKKETLSLYIRFRLLISKLIINEENYFFP